MKSHTYTHVHTLTHSDLSDASRPPHRRKQGVSCPLLILPTGAESLWKLLVNGHLIPPPTACHHLLSRHYSGPLRLPGGVVNRSPRIGRTVAALPKGLQQNGAFRQHPAHLWRSTPVARLAISPANADKWKRGGPIGGDARA